MISRYKITYLYIFIIVLAYSGFFGWSEYERTIFEAEKSTQNFADLLELKFEKVFSRAKSILDFQACEYSQDVLTQSAVAKNKQMIAKNMNQLITDFPEVSATYIFDSNGDMLYASDENTPKTNVADRPFFMKLKEKKNG